MGEEVRRECWYGAGGSHRGRDDWMRKGRRDERGGVKERLELITWWLLFPLQFCFCFSEQSYRQKRKKYTDFFTTTFRAQRLSELFGLGVLDLFKCKSHESNNMRSVGYFCFWLNPSDLTLAWHWLIKLSAVTRVVILFFCLVPRENPFPEATLFKAGESVSGIKENRWGNCCRRKN